MFRLQFNKSNSKYYKHVEQLVKNFYRHSFDGTTHIIDLTVKELFEKWDYFNELFWRTEKWKGTSFGYDDFDLYSKSDKKRLFYSLQLAHSRWINMSESYIRRMAPVYFEESFDEGFREEVFNKEDVDRLLDLINAEKYRIKYRSENEDE